MANYTDNELSLDIDWMDGKPAPETVPACMQMFEIVKIKLKQSRKNNSLTIKKIVKNIATKM